MNALIGFRRAWRWYVQHRFAPPVSVFFISIVMTLLFWAVLPASYRENESTDYLTFYEPVAQNILVGNGIVTPNGSPAIRYPLGFPLLLAGAFWTTRIDLWSESQAATGLILICVGTTALFLFLLGQAVSGTMTGLLGALLWGTYPFGLWLTKQPNSEIPFLAFFVPAVYFFWRLLRSAKPGDWKTAILVGSLLGCAMLIRPYAVGLPLLFAVFILIFLPADNVAPRLIKAGLLVGSTVLVVFPWQVWASGQTSEMVLLSSGGLPSIQDGLTFAVNHAGYPEQTQFPSGVVALTTEFDALARAGALDTWHGLLQVFNQEIRTRPGPIFQLVGIKAIRSWYATDSGRLDGVISLIQIGYLIAILIGAKLAWKFPSNRLFVLFVGLIALYFWSMTILALSILRYMLPAVCLLLILLPLGAYWNRRRSF